LLRLIENLKNRLQVKGKYEFHLSLTYLALDRTNWKWGKKNINIFTLAIAYKGVAIPVY